MTENEPAAHDEMTEEELGEVEGEPLPDREVMSIIAPPENTLPIEPRD